MVRWFGHYKSAPGKKKYVIHNFHFKLKKVYM